MNNEKRNPGGDATGLLQSLRSQDEKSLLLSGNIEVLVRKFLSEVFSAVEAGSKGYVSRERAISTIQNNCLYYARIFTGETKTVHFGGVEVEYTTDSKWHPTGLAAFIRKEMGMPPDVADDEAIADAWASLAKSALQIVESYGSDSERAVDALVAHGVRLFSGIKV
ncbi:MAG TPA: hypothetical protein VI457_03890 [Methylococcaceae bacterium]|nr:hypothetical protein [Methylococcaceae bacterium]